MAYTTAQVTEMLTDYAGEDDSYATYLTNGLLRHFKAGVNAAWRTGYDLERDETRYEAKFGTVAGNAFSDGFVYSASYL
jgi:hypothetical protein